MVTLLALAVMWWMSASFKHQEEAKDHAPSPHRRSAARSDSTRPASAGHATRTTWTSYASVTAKL